MPILTSDDTEPFIDAPSSKENLEGKVDLDPNQVSQIAEKGHVFSNINTTIITSEQPNPELITASQTSNQTQANEEGDDVTIHIEPSMELTESFKSEPENFLGPNYKDSFANPKKSQVLASLDRLQESPDVSQLDENKEMLPTEHKPIKNDFPRIFVGQNYEVNKKPHVENLNSGSRLSQESDTRVIKNCENKPSSTDETFPDGTIPLTTSKTSLTEPFDEKEVFIASEFSKDNEMNHEKSSKEHEKSNNDEALQKILSLIEKMSQNSNTDSKPNPEINRALENPQDKYKSCPDLSMEQSFEESKEGSLLKSSETSQSLAAISPDPRKEDSASSEENRRLGQEVEFALQSILEMKTAMTKMMEMLANRQDKEVPIDTENPEEALESESHPDEQPCMVEEIEFNPKTDIETDIARIKNKGQADSDSGVSEDPLLPVSEQRRVFELEAMRALFDEKYPPKKIPPGAFKRKVSLEGPVPLTFSSLKEPLHAQDQQPSNEEVQDFFQIQKEETEKMEVQADQSNGLDPTDPLKWPKNAKAQPKNEKEVSQNSAKENQDTNNEPMIQNFDKEEIITKKGLQNQQKPTQEPNSDDEDRCLMKDEDLQEPLGKNKLESDRDLVSVGTEKDHLETQYQDYDINCSLCKPKTDIDDRRDTVNHGRQIEHQADLSDTSSHSDVSNIFSNLQGLECNSRKNMVKPKEGTNFEDLETEENEVEINSSDHKSDFELEHLPQKEKSSNIFQKDLKGELLTNEEPVTPSKPCQDFPISQSASLNSESPELLEEWDEISKTREGSEDTEEEYEKINTIKSRAPTSETDPLTSTNALNVEEDLINITNHKEETNSKVVETPLKLCREIETQTEVFPDNQSENTLHSLDWHLSSNRTDTPKTPGDHFEGSKDSQIHDDLSEDGSSSVFSFRKRRSKSESNLKSKVLNFSVSTENLNSDVLTISFVGDSVNISSSSKLLAKSNIDISSTKQGTTLSLRPFLPDVSNQKVENFDSTETNPKATSLHEINVEGEMARLFDSSTTLGASMSSVSTASTGEISNEPEPLKRQEVGDSGYMSSDAKPLVSEENYFFEESSSIDTVIDKMDKKELINEKYEPDLPETKLYYIDIDNAPSGDDGDITPTEDDDIGEEEKGQGLESKFPAMPQATSGSHENIVDECMDDHRIQNDEDTQSLEEFIDAEFEAELECSGLRSISNETLNSALNEDGTLDEVGKSRGYRGMIGKSSLSRERIQPKTKKLLRFSHQVRFSFLFFHQHG